MPWDTRTLDFDRDGNLIIYDADLSKKLEKEIQRADRGSAGRFKIKVADTTGGGGPQVNAMCPC